MSSDRRAGDIYACGKHYDPNCQYRYMCQVGIGGGTVHARAATHAVPEVDKEGVSRRESPREKGSAERFLLERASQRARAQGTEVFCGTRRRRSRVDVVLRRRMRFFFSYAAQTSGPTREPDSNVLARVGDATSIRSGRTRERFHLDASDVRDG